MIDPDVFSHDGMGKGVEELRDQLISNGIQVTDIQASQLRSNDGMMVLITVGTPSHQRTLTAFDHFVNHAFRRNQAQNMTVHVYWRYQLPKQTVVQ